MKNKARNPIWISLVIVGLALTGCVQSQMAGSAVALEPNKAMMDNPVELVNQLSSDISEARMAQLNILSPEGFKKAERAFFSAQEDLEKGNRDRRYPQGRHGIARLPSESRGDCHDFANDPGRYPQGA